jgi:hypothetical protein
MNQLIIIPSNDHHEQEIIQTLQNEITTNHEPKTPASAMVNSNNYNYGQETTSTANNNRLSSQILKDDILQAIKQEIGQNFKMNFFKLLERRISIMRKIARDEINLIIKLLLL